MKPSKDTKFTIAEILTNFSQRQAQVQQEKMLKQQLKEALMKNQASALGQFVPGMADQMQAPEMNPEDMAFDEYYQQAKRGGIKLDPRKKGTFKAQATRMGMSVQQAAAHILANKEKYSPGMVKKANFARNFAKEEGGMIKRADGSYSQRGLWDNIRANRGSGKEPTKEMLEQERKIKRKYFDGGMTGDCDPGFEWSEQYQTCVPVVTEDYAKDYLTDWYSRRGQIVNDPNFSSLPKSEQHAKWLNKFLPLINERMQTSNVKFEYPEMIGDDPNNRGTYKEPTRTEGPVIQIADIARQNPYEHAATQLHEYTTESTQGLPEKFGVAQEMIVQENIKPYKEFLETSPMAAQVKADKDMEEELYNNYMYSSGQTPEGKGNVHSYVMNWRKAFNMDPTKVYTEEEIDDMVKQAEKAGFFTRGSAAYNDDLYKLYRLAKDNKSLANLFNLMANNTMPSRKNDDITYAKYGGDFGYMPNFF